MEELIESIKKLSIVDTNIHDLTLVTAFYDLSKYEQRNVAKTCDNYFIWAELLFVLDINLIFYTSAEYANRIMQARQNHNLLHKTMVCIKEFDELPFVDRFDELNEYFNETNLLLDNYVVKGRYTTRYAVLNWNKVYFIKDAMEKKYFDSNYIGWIDFGIYNATGSIHMPPNIYEALSPVTQKVNIMELYYTSEAEIADLHKYANTIQCKTAAALFIGHCTYMSKFIDAFDQLLKELLSEHIILFEEGIFGIMTTRNADLIDLSYGYYGHVIMNYGKIREPQDIILYNMKIQLAINPIGSFDIGEKLYTDCLDKLDPKQLFDVFDNQITAGFYCGKTDKSAFYAEVLVEQMEKNSELINLFLADKDRIMQNFSFLSNSPYLNKRVIEILNKI